LPTMATTVVLPSSTISRVRLAIARKTPLVSEVVVAVNAALSEGFHIAFLLLAAPFTTSDTSGVFLAIHGSACC
jgi:hypothetical protein